MLLFKLINLVNLYIYQKIYSIMDEYREKEIDDLDKKDIIRYLSQTFKDVIGLFVAMSTSDCIITGMKAMEFFVPEAIDKDTVISYWDFIVNANKRSTMIDHFNSIEEYHEISYTHDPKHRYRFDILTSVIKGGDKPINIRLMWSQYGWSPMKCVFDFHSSIDQCIITPSNAICMYKNETLKMQSYFWKGVYVSDDDDDDDDKYLNVRESSGDIMKIYESLGIKYIPINHTELKKRNISDENCILVHYHEDIIHRSLVTSQSIENTLYHEYVKKYMYTIKQDKFCIFWTVDECSGIYRTVQKNEESMQHPSPPRWRLR